MADEDRRAQGEESLYSRRRMYTPPAGGKKHALLRHQQTANAVSAFVVVRRQIRPAVFSVPIAGETLARFRFVRVQPIGTRPGQQPQRRSAINLERGRDFGGRSAGYPNHRRELLLAGRNTLHIHRRGVVAMLTQNF